MASHTMAEKSGSSQTQRTRLAMLSCGIWECGGCCFGDARGSRWDVRLKVDEAIDAERILSVLVPASRAGGGVVYSAKV
jgi:hypothetical protein